MLSGQVEDLDGGVFVSGDLARRYGVSVATGSPSAGRGGERELAVTGVYQTSVAPGVLVPQVVALPHLEEADAFTAFVAIAPGADEAAARAGLERALADRPGLVVRSRSETAEELRGAALVLRMLYALLVLAVVIGILGVANTLALSVAERTRRSGCCARHDLAAAAWALIRAESALIAVAGGVLGIGGGWLLGAMFQRAALRTGLLEAAVPAGQLLGALAGLARCAAAAATARRAARTDVLAAIASSS